MKKNIIFSLFTILFINTVCAQVVNESVLGVKSNIKDFEYKGDSVYLDLEVDLNQLNLSSNETAVFTPIISNSGQTQELPSFVLRGKKSVKSYNRNITLDKRNEQTYINIYNNPNRIIDYYGNHLNSELTDGFISYSSAVPYSKWMLNSEVLISCTVHSCCDTNNEGVFSAAGEKLKIYIPTIKEYTPIYKTSLLKPEKVAVKRKHIEYSSSLTFAVNSFVIDKGLGNNKQELDSINVMMESVVSDEDYTITAVNIVGYASPEGSLKHNQYLSEKRAQALETILKNKYSINHNLYKVTFGGENWDGLIPMVEVSNLDDKEKVLDIIKNVPIVNGRESRLMNLSRGNTYRHLLKNYFPALRLVVINVEFNIDAYNLDRIKEVIYTKPENLSLEEMFRLSETYDENSKEYVDLFQIAVKIYPNSEIAVHNALVAHLQKENLKDASEYANMLYNNTDSAPFLNTLGVYFMQLGDYTKAETLLQNSADLGNEDAKFNLVQLDNKLKNIEEIKKNEDFKAKILSETSNN